MGGWAGRSSRIGKWGQGARGVKGRQRVFFCSEWRGGDEPAPAYLAAGVAFFHVAFFCARPCLWGDAKRARQPAHWWQAFAWAELSRLHPSPQLVHNLLAQGIPPPRGTIEDQAEVNRINRCHVGGNCTATLAGWAVR